MVQVLTTKLSQWVRHNQVSWPSFCCCHFCQQADLALQAVLSQPQPCSNLLELQLLVVLRPSASHGSRQNWTRQLLD